MLYTKKGDKGTSGLFGTKNRFAKNSSIYEALGTVDELNSLLGICRARSNNLGEFYVGGEIYRIQECLFIIQAELAGAPKSIVSNNVSELEQTIEYLEDFLGEIHYFVIPGATEFSAQFDHARAVTRRAERKIVAVNQFLTKSSQMLAYINRLSSLLYVIARYYAVREKVYEKAPYY